jgi:hypothetical protein
MATMLKDTIRAGNTRLGSVEERADQALEIAKRKMGPAHDEAEKAQSSAKTWWEPAREYADHAREYAEHAVDVAKDVVASGKEGTTYDIVGGLSKVAKGISVVAGIASTLRSLGVVRGIPWSRPGRRGSTLGSLGIFGAGVLLGAGATALLTPMSGAKMRATLARNFEIGKQKAMRAIDQFAVKAAHARAIKGEHSEAKTVDAAAGAVKRPYDPATPFIGSPNHSR